MAPDAAALEAAASNAARRGDAAGAEAALQQAMTIEEHALGAASDGFIAYLDRLSMLSDRDGRFREAETYQRRALAIRSQRFGRGGAEAALRLNLVAVELYRQGLFQTLNRWHARLWKPVSSATGSR